MHCCHTNWAAVKHTWLGKMHRLFIGIINHYRSACIFLQYICNEVPRVPEGHDIMHDVTADELVRLSGPSGGRACHPQPGSHRSVRRCRAARPGSAAAADGRRTPPGRPSAAGGAPRSSLYVRRTWQLGVRHCTVRNTFHMMADIDLCQIFSGVPIVHVIYISANR